MAEVVLLDHNRTSGGIGTISRECQLFGLPASYEDFGVPVKNRDSESSGFSSIDFARMRER